MELSTEIELAVGPLGVCGRLEQVRSADSGSRGVEQIYLYVFEQPILVYGLLCIARPQAVFGYFFGVFFYRKP